MSVLFSVSSHSGLICTPVKYWTTPSRATTRADKSSVDTKALSSPLVFMEFVMANKKDMPAAFSAKSRTEPDGAMDVIVEKTIIKANIAMGTVLSPTVKLSL